MCSIYLWVDTAGNWNGSATYAPQSFTCKECGVSLKSRHNTEELRGLRDECPSCLKEKRRFGKRLLAGASATERLVPAEHEDGDSDDDRTQLSELYPIRSSAREKAFAEQDPGQ